MSLQQPQGALAPQIEPLVGQSGLHIRDPIEEVQALLHTDRSVTPSFVPADGFVFPVETAAEITVSELRIPSLIAIWIRDETGDPVVQFDPNDGPVSVPAGEYLLEFSGFGIKVYGRFEGSNVRIGASENAVVVSFGTDTRLRIGARSIHTQPARTLRTTRDPTDLMAAISLFGNAMKTWSPERTWPSLRGHPPLLELGQTHDVPSSLEPPETGITISVPTDHSWLYPVAPLAYWLGATVEPGEPALRVGSRSYPLGVDGGSHDESDRLAFERRVRDVLQFTFTFDCAVRTEGIYDARLDVRDRLEAVGVPIDFAGLYDAPIADRVARYLDVAETYTFDGLVERIGRPGWRLTADMEPSPDRATVLPFLARDLAVVRCPTEEMLEPNGETSSATAADARRSRLPPEGTVAGEPDVLTRSSARSSVDHPVSREPIIQLPPAESMSQSWIGDGFATHAAKASTTSYLRRLEKHAEGSDGISIDIVVNDDEMTNEGVVSDIYGTREHLTFDVSVHHNLSIDGLATVFERDTDFVHYIGHVDPEGFRCTDGYLDVADLRHVGMDSFVLNACTSYEQGQLLVEKGAIGGVITLEDVINSMATKIGQTIARLLNFGFPIGSATHLIQDTIFTGSNYAVVGDSNASIVQSNIPVPNVARIELADDGSFDVTVEAFATWNFDVGTMYRPYIEGCNRNYIVPGTLDSWRVDVSGLDRFLDTSTFPIVVANSLYWSDRVTAAELRDELLRYRS